MKLLIQLLALCLSLTSYAQTATTEPANKSGFPNCSDAQKNYRELAGELPKDYPALHFGKEQLIKTIVGIANNPNVNLEELAKTFGLRFVACIRKEFTREGEKPTYTLVHFSDAGIPLKPRKNEFDASIRVNYNYDLDLMLKAKLPTFILMAFSFDEIESKDPNKLTKYNCIIDTDFTEYVKDDWYLYDYYGHLSAKYYIKTINNNRVQFSIRPFLNPYIKPNPNVPPAFRPSHPCMTSASLLIQPAK